MTGKFMVKASRNPVKVVMLAFIVLLGLALLAHAFATSHPASVVIGQPNMTSNGVNQGGLGAHTLSSPTVAYTDGTKLYVADFGNTRVLIYNTIPTSSNASADVVVGQPNMTSNTLNLGGIGAHTLNFPHGVFAAGGKLFVVDTNNNRVLIYNSIPTSNNASADVVVGQPNMTSNGANQGGIGAHTLNYPWGVFVAGTKMFVADRANHRVLIYNTIPTANNASADVVVGQPNMVANTPNQGTLGVSTLFLPVNVFVTGTKMFIADTYNSRILIFNAIPSSNNASADVVVGQPNMTSGGSNQGGIGANTLYQPNQAYSDGTDLFVADNKNHRVLVYYTIPTSNNASANAVIGQDDMTSNAINKTGSTTEPTAETLYNPFYVQVSNGKLFVADYSNNRVLIYNDRKKIMTVSN